MSPSGHCGHDRQGIGHRYLIGGLAVVDALVIAASLLLAYWLRIGSGLVPYNAPQDFRAYATVLLFAVPTWLTIFALVGLYDIHYLLGGPQEYANVFKGCSFGTLALTVLGFFGRGTLLSRSWILLVWPLSTFMIWAERFLMRRLFFYLRRRGHLIQKALIVGANEQAKLIAGQLNSPTGSGYQVVGFLDDFLPVGSLVMEDLRVLGSPGRLMEIAHQRSARQAIVVPDAMAWESFQELIHLASQQDEVEIQLSPGFYEILTTGVRVTHKSFVPLLVVNQVRITGVDAVLKTVLDYGLGGLLALLSLPALVIIAVAIKCTYGGPILIRPRVLGRNGRPFRTWKLRIGCLDEEGRTLSPVVDRRQPQTRHPLGLYLYEMGLDKLPQLFNVLGGQMSLVGPRTVSVGQGDRYGQWLPSLLTIKPGITGPWAVAGRDRSLAAEITLDMYYIRNWTIWFDFQVLFQTIRHTLRRERGGGRMRKSE